MINSNNFNQTIQTTQSAFSFWISFRGSLILSFLFQNANVTTKTNFLLIKAGHNIYSCDQLQRSGLPLKLHKLQVGCPQTIPSINNSSISAINSVQNTQHPSSNEWFFQPVNHLFVQDKKWRKEHIPPSFYLFLPPTEPPKRSSLSQSEKPATKQKRPQKNKTQIYFNW